MTTKCPSLALGTVQFGVAYGVAGRGRAIPDDEVRKILRRAWELGVRRLDTAPAYGSIEERLLGLAGDLPFSIVTKVGPSTVVGDLRKSVARARQSLARSRERLGERLVGCLFHDASDLMNDFAEELWREAVDAGIPVGVSCYDAETLATIASRFPLAMAQVPGNALDQSLASAAGIPGVEITLRSVFLQGLLLMPLEQAVAKVPEAELPLRQWHSYCADHALAPLRAALSIAKGLPGIGYCVVGVDSAAQLEEIACEWQEAPTVSAPWLHVNDSQVADPRLWNIRS